MFLKISPREVSLTIVLFVVVPLFIVGAVRVIVERPDSDFNNIGQILKKYNDELYYYRHFGAELAWNMSVDMSQEGLDKNEEFAINRNIWNNEWCTKLFQKYHDDSKSSLDSSPWGIWNSRQLYLTCRGPRFTSYQLSNVLSVLGSMQKLYNKEICIEEIGCMRMEPDLNEFMEKTREEGKLKKGWMAWHKMIGTSVKPLYVSLVHMLNEGARQAGHNDMGECWREEMEMPDVKKVALELYSEVKHLYSLLHSYTRFKLEKFYKLNLKNGPIPAHLLGNMYAQNWQSLVDIVWDDLVSGERHDEQPLVEAMLPANATVTDMVKAAEGFFVSMGLPKLPDSFWKSSYFEDKASLGKDGAKIDKSTSKNCHGSAANMFGSPQPEYRMMMCAQVRDDDMVTIQHEIGHIMYFMAYRDLPTVFQDGANSAFHEAVGDSITYDLNQINTARGKLNMKTLLKTGLAKLPQVGFGLVMDLWRWNLFENEDDVLSWNANWWDLHYKYLGIKKPDGYNHNVSHEKEGLDAAGKFHVIDNIPYIRYFFASFLQNQFYESMCKATGLEDPHVGWTNVHSCKIRGSKAAGQLLWNMMRKGTSTHWSNILQEMTGSPEIQASSLLNYFQPLTHWLEEQVRANKLYVGW